jgi:hypothetical protein
MTLHQLIFTLNGKYSSADREAAAEKQYKNVAPILEKLMPQKISKWMKCMVL